MNRIISLALAPALLALACGEEETIGAGAPDRFEPITPANVLRNVELAFDNRDLGLFKTTLSPYFVFYFNPREVGKYPPGGRHRIPQSYSCAELVRRVNRLFETAYFISLTFDLRNVGEPEPEEKTYWAENVKVTLVVKADELRWFLYEGYANLEFEKYAAANGEDYWRIKGWRERTGPGFGEYPASTLPSFGAALAAF